MKKSILLSFCLASANAALACPHSEQQYLCPGTQVVYGSSMAEVVGVNPVNRSISIRYKSNGAISSGLPESSLSIAEGCLGDACVGDPVNYGSSPAYVVGVNPYSNTISIQYKSNDSISSGIPLNTVYGLGCVDSVCVGDHVIYGSSRAQIAGVNDYTGLYSIRYESNGSISSGIALSALALTNAFEKYGPNDPLRERRHSEFAPSGWAWSSTPSVEREPANHSGSAPNVCRHDREHFLCAGSKVIYGASEATVVGINPVEETVSISYISNGSISSGLKASMLALMEGCIGPICVGDHAIYGSSYVTIAAVNPYNNTASIRYVSNGSLSSGIELSSFYIDGCVRGVCKDDVALYGSSEVSIAGVNPFLGKYSIAYGNTGSLSSGIDLSSLALTTYCEKYGDTDGYRMSELIPLPESGSWIFRPRR